MSRRSFLLGGLSAGVGAALLGFGGLELFGGRAAVAGTGAGLAPSGLPASASTPSTALYRSAFASLVGERFHVAGTAPASAVHLDEVADVAAAPLGAEETFALLFAVDRRSRWSQGSYVFAHRTIGERSLFVVPRGQSPGTRHLVAIINNTRMDSR